MNIVAHMLAPHTQPTERNCCPPFAKNKISMRAFHYKSRIKILSHATLNYRTTHPRAPPAPLTAPNCPPPPPRHTYPRHKIPERDRVTSSTCSVPTSSHAASQFLQTSYKPDERPNRYATFVPVWTVIQNLDHGPYRYKCGIPGLLESLVRRPPPSRFL